MENQSKSFPQIYNFIVNLSNETKILIRAIIVLACFILEIKLLQLCVKVLQTTKLYKEQYSSYQKEVQKRQAKDKCKNLKTKKPFLIIIPAIKTVISCAAAKYMQSTNDGIKTMINMTPLPRLLNLSKISIVWKTLMKFIVKFLILIVYIFHLVD